MSIVKPFLPHFAKGRGRWRGLVHAWTLHEGAGVASSLVSHVDGTLAGAGTIWRQSIHGWAVYQPNTTGHRIEMPSLPVSTIIPDRFTVVVGFLPGDTTTRRPTFGFLGSGGANADNPFASYNGGLNFGNGSSHQLMSALPAAVTSSKSWVNIYAVTDDGTNYTVYHNGLQVNQAAITVNPASGTDRQFNIGTSGFGGSVEHPHLGWTLFYYIFNRALSGQELRVLAPDPYSFDRRERYWAITEAAAGGTTVPVVSLSIERGKLSRTLTWSATPEAAVYYLDWSANGTDWTQLARYEATTETYIEDTDRLSVESYYRVRATNAAGTGTSDTVLSAKFAHEPLDVTTDLIGAFDLRLVRSAYVGNCLRLRRDSDNAESDFGFVDGLVDDAAIDTWRGAARTYVVTWYNQDGSANHATQSSHALQPEYTDEIIFTGTEWLDVSGIAATFSGTDKEISVAAAARVNDTASARTLLALSRTTDSNPLLFFGFTSTEVPASARRSNAGTGGTLQHIGAGIMNPSRFYPVSWHFGPSRNFHNYLSGTNIRSPLQGDSAELTLDQARIGSISTALDGSYSSIFSGRLRSILIYSTPVSARDIRAIAIWHNFDVSHGLSFTPSPYIADNASAFLQLPVYSGGDYQAIHPDVFDAGEGSTIDGHRFWMVHTPYPGSDASKENPSIIVSDAAPSVSQVWTVPTGLTNPISGPPGTGNYGDTHLLRGQDDKWYVYWLHNKGGTSRGILESHSSDGVTWSSAVELIDTNSEGSPIVFWDGSQSQYVMFTTDLAQTPNGWKRRTSASPDSGWSAAATIAMPTMHGRSLWDSNIIFRNGIYHGFLGYSTGTGQNAVLHYARSDNGTNWTVYENALLNPEAPVTKWDGAWIYRSTAVITDLGTHLYYSAYGGSPLDWHTGYTTVSLVDPVEEPAGVPRPGVLMLGTAGMV